MQVDLAKASKGRVFLIAGLILFVLFDLLVAFVAASAGSGDLMKGLAARAVVIAVLFGLTYYGLKWARITMTVFLVLYAISVLIIAEAIREFFLFLYVIQIIFMAVLLHTSVYIQAFFALRKVKRSEENKF